MEGSNKVRLISQKEASEIDANNVEYFTLTDGTIIHIKKEGEEEQLINNQYQGNEQQVLAQNQEIGGEEQKYYQAQNELLGQNAEIQDSIGANQIKQQGQNYILNQYQKESQIQTQTQNQQILTENENQYQMNGELSSDNQGILGPGNNYGYYISGGNNKFSQKQYQAQQCTCNYTIPQGFLNYNAYLINAQIGSKHLIGQLGLKNLALSQPQFYQQGQMRRRQLYKLVVAYPAKINSVGGEVKNENINNQINSQQYNTNAYLIEKSNLRQKMEMNLNSQGQSNQIVATQNYSAQNNSLNQRIEQNNQQYGVGSYRFEQSGQIEGDYCTCDQNQVQMQQGKFQENEYQDGEELNDQNIEYCNCDLKYSEISQAKGNRAIQDIGEGHLQCTCPIGNSGVKKKFEIINSESGKKQ